MNQIGRTLAFGALSSASKPSIKFKLISNFLLVTFMMKFSTLIALLGVFGVAAAGSGPQLSLSIKDGSFDGLDGLDPTLKWSSTVSLTSGSTTMEVDGGIELDASLSNSDLSKLPKSFWAKATTEVSNWGVSARAEVDAQTRDSADIEFDANNTDDDLSVFLSATASSDGFKVKTVEATKGIDSEDGARITVNPRYDFETDESDVVVLYEKGDTAFKISATADNQEVTISQQIDSNNRIAPTLSSGGALSVEWERTLSDDSSITAILKPNEGVDIEWTDGAWTTNLELPMKGNQISSAKVGISRDIDF